MRFVILMLLALPAHAQVVGWIDCQHNAPGEKFGYIKVAVMDGNVERRSSTRHFDKLKPGQTTIEFSAMTGPAQLTGMRLACEIIVPAGLGVTTEETQYTLNWEKPIVLASGVKASPKLVLTLVQTPAGWRAYIGKAP